MSILRNRVRNSIARPLCITLALSASVLLAACSGGSSNNDSAQQVVVSPPDPTPTTQTLSGTAAIGAPVVDGTVTASCADGSGFTKDIRTETDGSWTGEIDSEALPCAIQVSGGTPPVTLHSVATAPGTINITPLTDLVLALATSQNPQDWFNSFDGSSADIAAASGDLLDTFASNGFNVPNTGNPFTTPFKTNGNGWDGLLDEIGQAVEDDPGLADHAALIAVVKDGNLDSLPTAPVPVMFSVTGSISGASGNVIWEAIAGGKRVHDGSDTDGAVTFSPDGGIAEGNNWRVTVKTAPAGQSCVVNKGSGRLVADVTNVEIVCSDVPSYSLTGTISGASAAVSWETRKNGVAHHSGSDSNGAVTFTANAGLEENSAWSVVVITAPAGQTCTVSNGSGTLMSNVGNIAIACSDEVVVPDTYTISGSISGASAAVEWRVQKDGNAFRNGTSNNGKVAFTAAAGMDESSAWSVQVTTAPAGQICAVSNGSGTLTANVTNVVISCRDRNVTPSDAIYDFSSLDLRPSVPNMTPIAPTIKPVDPSLDIAALFEKLGEREQARIFAPAPDNLTLEFDNYQREYSIVQRDKDSSWVRKLSINPGADGELNTADDTLYAYTVAPDGEQGISYSFTSPGPDAVWFTEDDVYGDNGNGGVVYFPRGTLLEYEDASEGVILILPFLEPGDDGQLFTADDEVKYGVGYQIAVLDGEGNRGQIVTYTGVGEDQQWFSADDQVNSYVMVTSALSGRQVISVMYDGAGADQNWFSADDVVGQHTQSQLDSQYLIRYSALYDRSGIDNTWFTADDRVMAWTYYGYDEDDNAVLVATHSSMGNDGIWFTADDTASGLVSLKDANGRSIIEASISGSGAMGPDGVWLSGDETLYSYAYTNFDEKGRRTLNAQMDSAGIDGLWFTADDQSTSSYSYWKRDYDEQGRGTMLQDYNSELSPTSPAFSEEHLEKYTVYNADFSNSVTVYRDAYGASFGADGIPFTADDSIAWPYTVYTDTGYEQYGQPGPDGMWFTGDDVRSGYVVKQYDGNRKVMEQVFGANDEVLSYSEATELSTNSYRTDFYNIDDNGDPVLGGYNIVQEGNYGYPRTTTWYSLADEITNIDYAEYDSRGNITRESAAYTPGNDGLWGTSDDFAHYAKKVFNSNNELVSQYDEYPGVDRIWGTADDYTNLGRIELLDYDIDVLPGNTGYLARSCDDLMSVASGAINVVVRDQNGDPLAGAIAQLNNKGKTATTDANGEASFSGLSGAQDLHLFKDGYAWESFYCVAPGNNMTVQARLSSRTEPAYDSKVNFQATPGNEYFTLRLLDDEGRSIANRSHASGSGGDYGQTYGALYFTLPEGTEVNGELWALQVDRYGVLTGAQSMGLQTYNTIGGNLYTDYQPIALDFESGSAIAVASSGSLVGPGNGYAQMTVSLGGLYELPFRYDPTLGGIFATVPDVMDVSLPALAQPTGVRATGDNWQAWYPGDYPQLGEGVFLASIITGFQHGPVIETQQASGNQPVVQWSPTRQVKDDPFATVTTLELRSAADGQGWQSHWTVHVPAGNTSVALPRVPAGITDAMLPQSQYRMVLHTRAIPELDYHTAVGTQDLHQLSLEFATEVLSSGSDFEGSNILLR
ncbi:Uncharacterised protein [Halioglobus japonicus]|nr:Uncharacterised protein [Halioglobus japonicus]